MTKLMTTLTIAAIASILMLGGIVSETPNAFSTYGGGHHDDDDDDCDKSHHGNNHHNDDNDCDNDEPKDPCDCEKPDTLLVKFTAPTEGEYRIEIFKKLDYKDNPDKLLLAIPDLEKEAELVVSASSFSKNKLESNTAFVVYKAGESAPVAEMEIHTSCSKALFKDMIVSDEGYSLQIVDGLKGGINGESSISASDPLTCGDEPEIEKTGVIVIRNALTKDNGGVAILEDFSYKVTDEIGAEFDLVQDSLDPSIHVAEVPKGDYTLTQTIASTITESYTEVLITGDKKCPATTNESFMIKKDKTVSCTIYNDDNGDGSGGSGGIVFQNNSMMVNLTEKETLDSCDHYDENGVKANPCIEIINSDGTIAIVDSELKSTTTIILFSVAQEDFQNPDTFGAEDPFCEQITIIEHDRDSNILRDENFELPVDPTENLVVLLQCANMDNSLIYNVNYVMINPLL